MWYSSLVPSLLDPPLLVAKYGTKSWGGASLEYSVHSLRAEVGWLMRLYTLVTVKTEMFNWGNYIRVRDWG